MQRSGFESYFLLISTAAIFIVCNRTAPVKDTAYCIIRLLTALKNPLE